MYLYNVFVPTFRSKLLPFSNYPLDVQQTFYKTIFWPLVLSLKCGAFLSCDSPVVYKINDKRMRWCPLLSRRHVPALVLGHLQV